VGSSFCRYVVLLHDMLETAAITELRDEPVSMFAALDALDETVEVALVERHFIARSLVTSRLLVFVGAEERHRPAVVVYGQALYGLYTRSSHNKSGQELQYVINPTV